MNTGFVEPDAAAAFARARRRQSLAKLSSRLRMRRTDALTMLRLEEVVAALGRVSERDLGVQSIPIGSIVGTVGRERSDFDRQFRPLSGRLRTRWQWIEAARLRGEGMAPIDVYRVGKLHFVRDGHHRVSVARANGDTVIEAYVREVKTEVPATEELTVHDLPLIERERKLHHSRPRPRPCAERKVLSTDEPHRRVGRNPPVRG